MESKLQKLLEKTSSVRYTRLHFELEILEDSNLPYHKASALRGGMGEMLLRASCIRNRRCEECDFAEECLVQRIMYSKYVIKPSFVTSGESIGYIINCEDHRLEFTTGDHLEFQMTLFGKTIAYLTPILQAFYSLGQYGIGKERCHFRILSVTNSLRERLVDGANVFLENYRILNLKEYIDYRMGRMQEDASNVRLLFHTPLSMKFQGEELTDFNSLAIVRGAVRRLYMLECFEGIETEMPGIMAEDVPVIAGQKIRHSDVRRYSSRHKSGIHLNGVSGYVDLEGVSKELLELLIIGEIVQIGKNTSFGFGRYTVIYN